MPELSRPLPLAGLFQRRILRGEQDRDWHTDILSFILCVCVARFVHLKKEKKTEMILTSFPGVLTAAARRTISISQTQAWCRDVPSGSLRVWVSQAFVQCTNSCPSCLCVRACVLACLITAKPHPSSVTRDIFGSSFIALVAALPILCISCKATAKNRSLAARRIRHGWSRRGERRPAVLIAAIHAEIRPTCTTCAQYSSLSLSHLISSLCVFTSPSLY